MGWGAMSALVASAMSERRIFRAHARGCLLFSPTLLPLGHARSMQISR
jgi:hypothetical protein